MFRRMIPLAVAIVILVGCKKKPADPTPTNGAAPDAPATHVLKIRAAQAGDRTDEVESESGTFETSFGGKAEKEKQDKKVEYSEHIIDAPVGAAKPTKLTRTYKVARQFDQASGAAKALSYEGKTVTIEKKGSSYVLTADGKSMNSPDTIGLMREFTQESAGKLDKLLPKAAVKVGEPWNIEPAALNALGEIPFPIDAAKSKSTGTLVRVYTKDGKPWGAIALDCDLVVGAAKTGEAGTIKMAGTIDTVIDGSSRETVLALNVKINVAGKGADGTEVKITGDLVATKTVKNAK